MQLRTWFAYAWVGVVMVSACGDPFATDPVKPRPDGSMQTPSEGDSAVQLGELDGGIDASASFETRSFLPLDEDLPLLPAVDIDSGAPAGSQIFARNNPVLYMNDYPDSVYTDAYLYALASNSTIRLVGVVSTGTDCNCSNGDNVDSLNRRSEWIAAAQEAGFQNLPKNTQGGFGPAMPKPASGMIKDTARVPSAGSDLIVAQAKLASREVPLVIVSGGPITPLADAYLQDPTITRTIVVSWLVGSVLDDNTLSLTTGFVSTDQWAAEIVLRNFRVYAFPVAHDLPAVSPCRLTTDVPPTYLKTLLLSAGYYDTGFDGDGPPAVVVNYPAYIKRYTRVSMKAATGLDTQQNTLGNVWLSLQGDGVTAGEDYFRELRKAYKVSSESGSFAGDAGCMQ